MTSRGTQALQALFDGDLPQLKEIIPDADTYAEIMREVPPTELVNHQYGTVYRLSVSTFKEEVRNMMEGHLIEVPFHNDNFIGLSYLASLNVISLDLSGAILKRAIHMNSTHERLVHLIESMTVETEVVFDLLNLTIIVSTDEVNASLLNKLTQLDTPKFKEAFNSLIFKLRSSELPLTPFFEVYPGAIDDQFVQEVFDDKVSGLDLTFEKSSSLSSQTSLADFHGNEYLYVPPTTKIEMGNK